MITPMRVRKQDQNGDYVFGRGSSGFWSNQVDGIAQIIGTRLLLFTGEWFLDQTEGMPWGGFPLSNQVVLRGQVLGTNTQAVRDLVIKMRVLETPGVIGITDYSSSVDPSTRQLTVSMKVNTIYGAANLLLSGTPSTTGQFELDITPLDSNVPLR